MILLGVTRFWWLLRITNGHYHRWCCYHCCFCCCYCYTCCCCYNGYNNSLLLLLLQLLLLLLRLQQPLLLLLRSPAAAAPPPPVKLLLSWFELWRDGELQEGSKSLQLRMTVSDVAKVQSSMTEHTVEGIPVVTTGTGDAVTVNSWRMESVRGMLYS